MSVCTSSPRTLALAGESSTARLEHLLGGGPVAAIDGAEAGVEQDLQRRRRDEDDAVAAGPRIAGEPVERRERLLGELDRQRHGGEGARLAIPVGDGAIDGRLQIGAGGLGRVELGRGREMTARDRRRRQTPQADRRRGEGAVILGEVGGGPGLEGGRVQPGELVTRHRPAGTGEIGQHVLPDEAGVADLGQLIEIRVMQLFFELRSRARSSFQRSASSARADASPA